MERKPVAGLMLALLLASMVSIVLIIPAKAEYAADSRTVALWHFDEVSANDVTPDAADNNPGTLVAPSGGRTPMAVEGKFQKIRL